MILNDAWQRVLHKRLQGDTCDRLLQMDSTRLLRACNTALEMLEPCAEQECPGVNLNANTTLSCLQLQLLICLWFCKQPANWHWYGNGLLPRVCSSAFSSFTAFAGAIRAFALTVFGKRGRTGVLAPRQWPSEHALRREAWKQNRPEHHKSICWSWCLWMLLIINDHNLMRVLYIPIPDRLGRNHMKPGSKDAKNHCNSGCSNFSTRGVVASASVIAAWPNATRIDTAFALTQLQCHSGNIAKVPNHCGKQRAQGI